MATVLEPSLETSKSVTTADALSNYEKACKLFSNLQMTYDQWLEACNATHCWELKTIEQKEIFAFLWYLCGRTFPQWKRKHRIYSTAEGRKLTLYNFMALALDKYKEQIKQEIA